MASEQIRQDRRLNVDYKTLMGKLSPERRKQLQDAQRLWIKYSQANCDFYYDPNGGTAAQTVAHECSIKAKAARADELEQLIE